MDGMENIMMENTELNVVLGANGNVGSYIVKELLARGKNVRTVSRSGNSNFGTSVEVVKADAFDLESLKVAVQGATTIYHCIGLPYQDFPKLEIIMDNVIRAAANQGNETKVVYADNLYAYGKNNVAKGALKEDLPHLAEGKKGKIRSRIENNLLKAHKEEKLKATIGKASDFFGPGAKYSVLGMYLFEKLNNGNDITLQGNLDKRHSFIYLPDFGKGLVTLGENENAFGEVWHLPHVSSVTVREFVEMVLKEANTESKNVKTMSKLMLLIGSLFIKTAREFREVAYQWENDFVVDSSKFASTFDFQPTKPDIAIHQTVKWHTNNKS